MALPMASCADRCVLLTSTARITSGMELGHAGLGGQCHPRGFVSKCGAGRVQGAWPCRALPGSTASVPTEQGWGQAGRTPRAGQEPQGWAGPPGLGAPSVADRAEVPVPAEGPGWKQGTGTGVPVLKAAHGLCSLTLGLHPFMGSEC